MRESEIRKYPFNIRILYDAGYSWEEAEEIVRRHCKGNNIDSETCEKLLSMREEIQPEPMVFDPPLVISDDSIFEIEPYIYENGGIKMNIYQMLKEQNLTPDMVKTALNKYCEKMGYDGLRTKKVFDEWKYYCDYQ